MLRSLTYLLLSFDSFRRSSQQPQRSANPPRDHSHSRTIRNHHHHRGSSRRRNCRDCCCRRSCGGGSCRCRGKEEHLECEGHSTRGSCSFLPICFLLSRCLFLTRFFFDFSAQIGSHTFHLREIFGLTSSTTTNPQSNPPSYPPQADDDPYASTPNECIICLVSPRDVVLLPCRHLVVCKECAIGMVEFGAGGKVMRREGEGEFGASETTNGGEAAGGGEGGAAAAAEVPVPATPTPAPATGRRKKKAKGWQCPVRTFFFRRIVSSIRRDPKLTFPPSFALPSLDRSVDSPTPPCSESLSPPPNQDSKPTWPPLTLPTPFTTTTTPPTPRRTTTSPTPRTSPFDPLPLCLPSPDELRASCTPMDPRSTRTRRRLQRTEREESNSSDLSSFLERRSILRRMRRRGGRGLRRALDQIAQVFI